MSASVTSGTYPRASVRSSAHNTGPASGGLQQAASAVWQFLLRIGASRAQPELMRLSRRYAQTDPALSRQFLDAARNLMKG